MSNRPHAALAAGMTLSLLLAACGGGGGAHKAAGAAGKDATTTSAADGGTSGTAGGSTGGNAGGSTASTQAASAHGSTTTTTAKGGTGTTAATTATTATTSASGGSGPALPAQAGTYKYHQSGHQTAGPSASDAPSQGTLTIDPANSSGVQQWHRVVSPNQWSSDTTLAFGSAGPLLQVTKLNNSAGDVKMTATCTFNPPMPAPPWPLKVGNSFSGHADCGDFTVDITGSVTGTRDVAIDGAARTTYVVSSQLSSHGQVESTGSEVDWYDPASRIPLHVETHQQGTYGVVEFSQDLTSDLLSLKV